MSTSILKQYTFSLLIFASLLFSCRVMLVPEYSAQLEEQIARTAKANDKLYIDMMDVAESERTYNKYSERYNEIESEINSIRLKNEARSKNADFLVINKNLKEAFDEAKNFHRENGVLKNGEIKAYQASIAAFWKPLYIAEIALKPAKRQ